ncbi:MAG: hypothetical protein KJ927_07860, partial [Candidatus Eisenbacteria bacterium]|nr:hypothetical protein [Candidatus Eisenbacteria bacterium]
MSHLFRRADRFHTGHRCFLLTVALAVIFLLGMGGRAQGVDIIDLHHNTSSGVPAAPYGIGTAVTVHGVVTVGSGVFTADYTDVWVQDGTAGINIYHYAVPHQFALGDSVTINGTIDQYRGLTEVAMTTYTVHSSGATPPEPLVVTCDDVEHAFLPDYSEPNEARLIRINDVSWTGAWPSFSGPITLHDESGTCVLYIDGTTAIQNMTPPAGSFDVVGIVKQYAGFTPPYTSGYELMPRSSGDFFIHAGPQIVNGPRETELQHNDVTIHIETSTACTAVISYGLTDAYEIGTATDGVSTTVHDILTGGLDPATVYHYSIDLEDGTGLTTTPDRLFSSASAAGGIGTIQAIFNKSVDHNVATYEQALGGQDLEGWIIDRIDATNLTLDVAIYSFDLPAVADALIAAKNRGVQIRFIYDNRDTYQAEVTRLISNGITVIDDAYGANTGNEIMHHKLWVFDAYSPDPADPWVYAGSWNLSVQGTNTDAQNVIMIQDQALARTCTIEMDEMWGSSSATPNASNSHFGTNKIDNTPKIFNVGGKEIEIYFAPSDPWLGALIDQVETADLSINFCILSFTRFDLTNEMEDRWLNSPGMKIRGVFDSGESGNTGSQYFPMNGEG